MAFTPNTINLTKRESPGAMVRRVVPTTARLQLTLYDRKNRTYKAVPGYLALLPIASRPELLRLWKQIRDVMEGGTWKDAGDAGSDLHVDSGPVSADGVDRP